MQRLAIQTLAAAAALLVAQQVALANEYVTNGERFYAKGDYATAQRYFEAGLAIDPQDAAAHYCLANVLLKLQKPDNAIGEYREAMALSRDGKVGEYSKKALASLLHGSSQSNEFGSGGAFSQANQTGSSNSNSPSGITGQQPVTGEKARILAEGEARVAQIKAESKRQIGALSQELQSNLLNVGDYSPAKGSASGARFYNTNVQSDYDARINALRQDAARRITETQKFYKEKADAFN